jgi:MinD-like ATPase involved in chromosome partitioning or flagellar assembly
VATDDRDQPAEAAEDARDDMPAGPPASHTDNGKSGADAGRPDPSAAGPDDDASPAPPGTAEPGGPADDHQADEHQADEHQDDEHQDDDFEPYLPPGPNPFSSVHPQGPPPYRLAGNGERHDAEPGLSGFAEHGYPTVSPYPPLPQEPPGGAGGQGGHGAASPFPAYRPYGPEDEAATPVIDYGLPSPQAYGFAPPPPPVEPLPDLGVPGQAYHNEPREQPAHHHDDAARDDELAPPAPEQGRPDGGYQGPEGTIGQQQSVPAENGRRFTGLRGPGTADIPPRGRPSQPPGMPVDRTAPGPGYPPASPVPQDPGPSGAATAGPARPGPGQTGPGQAGSVRPGPGYGGPAQAGRRQPAAGRRGMVSGLRPGTPLRPGPDEAEYPPPGADADALQEGETADSLTAEALLQGKRPGPGSGWRRTVFRATGGLVRVGESASSQRRRELIWRARTPVAGGHHRVAVMSLKGGVGKTTTTVGLGATLGTLRGDRVIAVDANPDRGTLSDKVRLETSATVRDLLNERQQIHRYADVRAFTSQASSRLEVLASDRDPGVSVAFSEADYCDIARVLEHYYSICITDCGTGLLHSAMTGVLTLADQIVLVSSPSVDGARSASATLDWLEAHAYGDLVRNAVVVLSTVRPRSKSTVDLDRLEQHFASRCRAVVRIPYDSHLEEGAEVELEQLSPATTEAYLRLAATVGDGFARPRRSLQRSVPAHP